MKKRNFKTIKLNKRIISTLSITSIHGGFMKPIEEGTAISYCHVGSNNDCCA
jgi:hypothetical protein